MNQYFKDTRQGIVRLRMNIKTIYSVRLTNFTIYRYMRLNSVQSIIRKKKRKYSKVEHHKIPNLLQRDFSTTGPNQKWSIDVSYLKAIGKTLYLCALKDMYDKSIVDYHISKFNDNQLVFETLNQALKKIALKKRKGLIIHSDQGIQFTSKDYAKKLKQNHIVHSVSAKGSCVDNVPIEFFGTTFIYNKDGNSTISDSINSFEASCSEIDEGKYELVKREAKRVEDALSYPYKYWNFEYTFSAVGDAFDYISLQEIPTKKCIVTGVKFSKNADSIYYLDNVIDNGSFQLYTRSLRVGNMQAHTGDRYYTMEDGVNDMQLNNCEYTYDEFNLQDQTFTQIVEGRTYYFLFITYKVDAVYPLKFYYRDLVTHDEVLIANLNQK